MALQDAQMFATLLGRGLEKFGDEKKTIDVAISGLYELRHQELTEVQRKAMSTKGFGSEPSTLQAFVIYGWYCRSNLSVSSFLHFEGLGV